MRMDRKCTPDQYFDIVSSLCQSCSEVCLNTSGLYAPTICSQQCSDWTHASTVISIVMPSTTTVANDNHGSLKVIIGILVSIFILICAGLILGICCYRRRNRKSQHGQNIQDPEGNGLEMTPLRNGNQGDDDRIPNGTHSASVGTGAGPSATTSNGVGNDPAIDQSAPNSGLAIVQQGHRDLDRSLDRLVEPLPESISPSPNTIAQPVDHDCRTEKAVK